ncbi:MAG: thioesterase family protein [Desulfocapsaceae bacterium]
MEINQTYEMSHTVELNDLASSLSPDPNDVFPPVFATSRMIAFMEFCSARFMSGLLKDGELSVGVAIDIKHTVPTLPGEEVTLAARYLGRKGKLYRFKVSVSDKLGVVSEGEHTRAIVNTEKLMRIAAKRAG